jgi:subtilase family serine protease
MSEILANRDRRKNGPQTNWESLETRCLLSASSIVLQPQLQISPDAAGSSMQGYSPAQIEAAYGFNAVTLPKGAPANGAGQTIAIVDAFNDPNIASDLSTFDKQFSLPTANLSVVGQTGSSKSLPTTDAGWATEISLDVEWAHAVAPGAKILLVEAKSDSISDLMAGVNYARNAAGVSVVSLSWGGSEFFQETQYDSDFTTPAGHQGVTFVAASGDEGSFSGPSWPASSANVLAVGGTTLNLTSTNTIASETAWSDSTGGFSRFEAEPSYQQIAQFSGGKSSPDVAYDANPNTGFAVYDSLAFEGDSGWQVYGGTSAGTPQWAAIVAIADQGRAANGAGTLDGATGTLPTLYSLYTAQNYFNTYNDITVGRSGFRTSAQPGYDLVTGLGSPQASAVVSALINSSFATTATVKAKATAQVKVRSQTRRAVVEAAPLQQDQQNRPQSSAAQKQAPIEVQISTATAIAHDDNDIATPSFERAASNVQTIGNTKNATFSDASTLQSQQQSQTETPLLGQFSFGKKSAAANRDSQLPDSAIQIHDSVAEAGLLATREENSSTAWKQIACLLGAGAVIGTYSAKVRRQKRAIGKP